MMSLDKCIGLNIPFVSFLGEEDLEKFKPTDKSHRNFSTLDRICSTEDEINKLVFPLQKMSYKGTDLLKKPALKEFEMCVSEPHLSPFKTTLRFIQTSLPQSPFVYEKNGQMVEMVPWIDTYLTFQGNDGIDAIITLFTVTIKDSNGKVLLTATSSKEMWRSTDISMTKYVMLNEQLYFEIIRNVKLIYLAVQKAIYDKPMLFTLTDRTRIQHTFGNTSKKHKKKNRVKVIKRYVLNPEELKKYGEPQRHMSCPCWGVLGHWRTYKSGKIVWINPYRKGKERDNASAYMPKNYVLED